jgi:hypothetical protein
MPTSQLLQLLLVEAKEDVFNRLGSIFKCENWAAQGCMQKNPCGSFQEIFVQFPTRILVTGHFSHEVG